MVGVISYKVNSSYAIFTDTIKGEKVIELTVANHLNKTTVFTFKEEAQEYIVPKDGYYYIEMAGASGGSYNETYHGGYGGYTSGYIYLKANEKLYFYVGQAGKTSVTKGDAINTLEQPYNGGGKGATTTWSTNASATNGKSSGGGATDVRLVGGTWDDEESLISRIMVAGGGAGAVYFYYDNTAYQYSSGGNGGTLYGGFYQVGATTSYTNYLTSYTLANQKTPGSSTYNNQNISTGSFGIGGTGYSGGGSGYYGGAGGYLGQGGGSSYISGYAGVNSVEENITITHINQTLHYSGKYFIGGKMLEGQNSGNGYAKITYVDEKPKRKNEELDNVRYIKNCSSYSSANNYNHWNEVQAIKDGVNIAKGKAVIGSNTELSTNPYSRITDGDITYTNYSQASSQTTNQCITVDLEQEYDLDEVAVWNYFGDQRSYYDNITYVSKDNETWKEVINEASIETSNGHRMNAYTNTYNGYIQDNLVVWLDGYANTGGTKSLTTTSWKDLSGTGNNGTVSGATWKENYLSFDGSGDYVYKTSASYGITNNKYTLEIVFIPLTAVVDYQMIFGTANTGTNVLQYMTTWLSLQTRLGFDYSDGTSYQGLQYYLDESEIGTMFKTTNILDSRTAKMYINKNMYKTIELPFDSKISSSNMYIGGIGTDYSFNGKIYSVRVYNKALTHEEIMHNYLYDKERFNLE